MSGESREKALAAARAQLASPDVMLDDIVLLCGKVFADHEELERVLVDDLVVLRDSINALRNAITGRNGYESVPKLVRPEKV